MCSVREKILESALDIIQEKTVSGLRIRQVAERAGVFQSNIHYYFPSKDELLLSVQRKVLSHYIKVRQDERKKDSPEKTLESELNVFISQKLQTIQNEKKYDIAELDFWNQSRISEKMHEEFCRSYANWRQEVEELLKKYAPEMMPEKRRLLAAVFISMLEGASVQYLSDPAVFDLKQYFEYCREMLIREIDRFAKG